MQELLHQLELLLHMILKWETQIKQEAIRDELLANVDRLPTSEQANEEEFQKIRERKIQEAETTSSVAPSSSSNCSLWI